MPTNPKHKRSASQKLILDPKPSPPIKKKLHSPNKITSKLKSKTSNIAVDIFPSEINLTNSYVINNNETTSIEQTLKAQHSMPSLRSKRGSQISRRGESKIKKGLAQKVYNMPGGSDYEGAQPERVSSELKWPSKNYKGSVLNTEICYEYGYSQLTCQKSKIKKQSPKKKKCPDQSEIQRLLAKYSKHIQKPPVQTHSNEKKQNFRTLSTDDKSQKKFQFRKRPCKNHKKKESTTAKVIEIGSPEEKRLSNKKDKGLKIKRKKNSSKTLLPDYFGCLLINRVESKIQRMKKQEEKSRSKKSRESGSRQPTYRKSGDNLQTTRIKEEMLGMREVKQFCNKDTKKGPALKYPGSGRSTLGPQKRKSEEKPKLKGEKRSRSRKESKKEIK